MKVEDAKTLFQTRAASVHVTTDIHERWQAARAQSGALICCGPYGQRCDAFLDRSVLAYKHAAQASGFRDTHSLALRACIAGSKCFTALPKGALACSLL